MNILLVIEGTYPWYRGGVSEWVYQYLKHLEEVHFSILQIATDEFQGLDPSTALYPLTDNINEFIRVSPPEMQHDSTEYLMDWYKSSLSDHESLKSDFDLIHVTNTGFAGWLGGQLSDEVNAPLMLTEHAIYWKEVEMGAVALECGYKIPEGDYQKAKVVSAFKEFAAYTYSEADRIVTVSESNIPFQKDLGATDIEYIPNGIPSSWIKNQKNRGNEPVIGWVGRCAEMKNPLAFFDLVDAFRESTVSPGFKMLLSDANEKGLENEVKSRAENYPEVECIWNQPSKLYFKNFDFLSITSHNESQPLVMLEALANKVLPVGFRVGDLTEKYGLVTGSGSTSETLVTMIEEMWSSQVMMESAVEKRFNLVKAEHTWEHIFSRYEKLIEQITEREAVNKGE